MMASVATAPNDSNDDRLGTEKNDWEDEDKRKGCDEQDPDSDVTDNVDFQNALLKIKELQKTKQKLTAQYSRALKQRFTITVTGIQLIICQTF